MLRIILKLWPAMLPVAIYCFWVLIIERLLLQKLSRKKGEINGEKIVGESSSDQKKQKAFSLHNRSFVAIMYLSLFLAILMLIRLGV